MNVTPEQIIDSLFAITDQLCDYLRVHDGETANECRVEIDEIYEQYQAMKQ